MMSKESLRESEIASYIAKYSQISEDNLPNKTSAFVENINSQRSKKKFPLRHVDLLY